MPRPGTDIYIIDAPAPGGPSLDTGQAFFAGSASRGSVSESAQCKSLVQFEREYGPRSGASLLYDAASAFFTEGGNTLNVIRVAGAGVAAATASLGTFSVDAVSPGAWANGLLVETIDPATTRELLAVNPLLAGDPIVVTVSDADGNELDRSPTIGSAQQLLDWQSSVVDITGDDTMTLPASGATATLATGADGATADADDLTAALEMFPYALGPGQVAAPGWTSGDAHTALMAHADTTKRCALLDLPDTGNVGTLGAAVSALYGQPGARMSAAFGPWIVYPGPASGSTVVMPYSGVQAGLLARVDAAGNPNQPAAGINGIAYSAIDLSQTFTDDDRQALNEVGVTLGKVVYGDVRTYGGRTVSVPDDANWLWFGNSRVLMSIAHNADAIAENYVLRQIDGHRHLFAALEADLRGMLLGFYNGGALYGDSPPAAFTVDTGDSVNTLETIAAGEVHAAVYVRCSPSAEYVRIDIVKVPLERQLAVA